MTHVLEAELKEWRGVLAKSMTRDLVVVDTPPSVEDHIDAIYGLTSAADFVLVPTGTSVDDLDSVVPWMRALVDRSVKATFCMNKVNTRTNSFGKAKGRLLKVGAVSPVKYLHSKTSTPCGKWSCGVEPCQSAASRVIRVVMGLCKARGCAWSTVKDASEKPGRGVVRTSPTDRGPDKWSRRMVGRISKSALKLPDELEHDNIPDRRSDELRKFGNPDEAAIDAVRDVFTGTDLVDDQMKLKLLLETRGEVHRT